MARSKFNNKEFCAAIKYENIEGYQFHPEKSGNNGLMIYKNLKKKFWMKTLFNLPKKIIFCKKCVTSNQRPCSYPEFSHRKERINASYLHIDKDGVCDACRVAEEKQNIDWIKEEKN